MCVLYVSYGSNIRPIIFGCISMGSQVLFIFKMSRSLLCSPVSGVSREQVVLSGFSVRLLCFLQTKTLCRFGCMYFLATLVIVCLDVMVMSSV